MSSELRWLKYFTERKWLKDTGRSYVSGMSHRIAGVGELVESLCKAMERSVLLISPIDFYKTLSLHNSRRKRTSIQSVIKMEIIHSLVNGFCVGDDNLRIF